MENLRPKVEKFVRSCEHLFGFIHGSGMLTPAECQFLEYYVEELQKQISPHCMGSTAPSQDSPTCSAS